MGREVTGLLSFVDVTPTDKSDGTLRRVYKKPTQKSLLKCRITSPSDTKTRNPKFGNE